MPERWRNIGDPRFAHAEWAATLGRYLDPPWEAACYLVKGHATCYAEQYFLTED
jgi:hypothetical protein